MTHEQHNDMLGKLGLLADLIYQAQEHVAGRRFREANEILQAYVTPRLQVLSHDIWLQYHRSGTGESA